MRECGEAERHGVGKGAAAAPAGHGGRADGSAAAHDTVAASAAQVIGTTVRYLVVSEAATRRAFLGIIGAGVALRTFGDVFPLGTADALAQEAAAPVAEKERRGVHPDHAPETAGHDGSADRTASDAPVRPGNAQGRRLAAVREEMPGSE